MESRKAYLRRWSPGVPKRLNFKSSKLFLPHHHTLPSLSLSLFSFLCSRVGHPSSICLSWESFLLQQGTRRKRMQFKDWSCSQDQQLIKVQRYQDLLGEEGSTMRRKIQDWSRWIPVEIEHMCGSRTFGSKIIDSGEFQPAQRIEIRSHPLFIFRLYAYFYFWVRIGLDMI